MYKLFNQSAEPCVIRTSDGAYIPFDEANTDYQAFLKYQAEGGVVLPADGNEVAYDLQAVTAQAQADAQAVIDTKASALAKLAALGLTQDEVKALVG